MSYEFGNKVKILIISGATATGKSDLANKIAMQKNGIIINADSMQLYQELPILSAQPQLENLKQAPHFLYSILKHNQNSSVASWLFLATQKIDQALQNNQLPIIVGGTGLYISKLIDGINQIPEIEQDLKDKIRQMCQNSNKEELIKILLDFGEDLTQITTLDKQRLGRRIEVFKQTGKSLSWWQRQANKIFYPTHYFHHTNIVIDRQKLYQNCNQRLALMFSNGAIDEVQNLLKQNPSPNSPINKTIGFLEIKDYLTKKINKEEAIEIASKKTRNYAKRQLTWFRNQTKNNPSI
jgi:tRNA dimethylallyltransferase